MAGFSPTPRVRRTRAVWPGQLHRGSAWLAAGSVFYWLAFAFGGWTLWINGVGVLYVDLLLAWIGVLMNVLAWPDLWDGLKGLVASKPGSSDALVARRSFYLVLGLAALAAGILPLEYRAVGPTGTWILVLYITAFPYLAWLFVPTLALYGIAFGRVGNLLDGTSKRLTDAGAMVLFAVAAATTAIVLHTPASTVFVQSWSVGFGILPAASCAGYILIAVGLTHHALPEPAPTRGWALAKTPRAKEPWA
ncbi:MAG TPA: hypothetical protein VEY12_12960 [Thermoplasmata archaeon]|nr:hypothetical protein [Thermoplasmata archaeon]